MFARISLNNASAKKVREFLKRETTGYYSNPDNAYKDRCTPAHQNLFPLEVPEAINEVMRAGCYSTGNDIIDLYLSATGTWIRIGQKSNTLTVAGKRDDFVKLLDMIGLDYSNNSLFGDYDYEITDYPFLKPWQFVNDDRLAEEQRRSIKRGVFEDKLTHQEVTNFERLEDAAVLMLFPRLKAVMEKDEKTRDDMLKAMRQLVGKRDIDWKLKRVEGFLDKIYGSQWRLLGKIFGFYMPADMVNAYNVLLTHTKSSMAFRAKTFADIKQKYRPADKKPAAKATKPAPVKAKTDFVKPEEKEAIKAERGSTNVSTPVEEAGSVAMVDIGGSGSSDMMMAVTDAIKLAANAARGVAQEGVEVQLHTGWAAIKEPLTKSPEEIAADVAEMNRTAGLAGTGFMAAALGRTEGISVVPVGEEPSLTIDKVPTDGNGPLGSTVDYGSLVTGSNVSISPEGNSGILPLPGTLTGGTLITGDKTTRRNFAEIITVDLVERSFDKNKSPMMTATELNTVSAALAGLDLNNIHGHLGVALRTLANEGEAAILAAAGRAMNG